MKCCEKQDIWYDATKHQDFCKSCGARWNIIEYYRRVRIK